MGSPERAGFLNSEFRQASYSCYGSLASRAASRTSFFCVAVDCVRSCPRGRGLLIQEDGYLTRHSVSSSTPRLDRFRVSPPLGIAFFFDARRRPRPCVIRGDPSNLFTMPPSLAASVLSVSSVDEEVLSPSVLFSFATVVSIPRPLCSRDQDRTSARVVWVVAATNHFCHQQLGPTLGPSIERKIRSNKRTKGEQIACVLNARCTCIHTASVWASMAS